jgi:hypothetical protein
MFPRLPLLDRCRLPRLSARSADDASSRRRRFAQYRFIPSLAACDDRRRPSPETHRSLSPGSSRAYDGAIALNPLAEYPHKTRFHELTHVVHGHFSEGSGASVAASLASLANLAAS